jgi:hypothetical protein
MAVQPAIYPEWATDDIQQLIDINGDAIDEVLDNKIEPTPEWKASGQLFQENLPYPYFNFEFNLIDEWVQHLDQRQIIGDIHISKSGESAANISTRLGGTWVDHGTDTLAGQTVNVFEKIA